MFKIKDVVQIYKIHQASTCMNSHGALFVVVNITEGSMQYSSLADSERSKSTAKSARKARRVKQGNKKKPKRIVRLGKCNRRALPGQNLTGGRLIRQIAVEGATAEAPQHVTGTLTGEGSATNGVAGTRSGNSKNGKRAEVWSGTDGVMLLLSFLAAGDVDLTQRLQRSRACAPSPRAGIGLLKLDQTKPLHLGGDWPLQLWWPGVGCLLRTPNQPVAQTFGDAYLVQREKANEARDVKIHDENGQYRIPRYLMM